MTGNEISTSLSTNAAGYSNVGSQFENKRKDHADRASMALILMVVTTIVGTFFDYQIYLPIAKKIVYTNSDFSNMVTCLFLAATPIIAAWALAHLMTRMLNKRERKVWHFVLFAVVLLLTGGLLATTCWLRVAGAGSNASENATIFAWALNVLAILIAFISFVIHLFLTQYHDKHKALADRARIERDITETLGEAKRFIHTSSIDDQREAKDHENYVNSFDALADQYIDLQDQSRDVNAQLYAETPEQAQLVKDFPKRTAGIACLDRAQAKKAFLAAVDAPARGHANHGYGFISNEMLDEEAAVVTEDIDNRYRALISGR